MNPPWPKALEQPDEEMTTLAGWANFYVIVGSSAGGLIGLQFVVVTLIADMPMAPGMAQAGSAFGAPTVVHFATVLLLAAVSSIPWPGTGPVAILWGIIGLGGVVFGVIVARRARSQTVYRPDFEDRLFHVLLPFAAYALLSQGGTGGETESGLTGAQP